MFDFIIRHQEKKVVKRIEKTGKKILNQTDHMMDNVADIITAVINVFVPKDKKP